MIGVDGSEVIPSFSSALHPVRTAAHIKSNKNLFIQSTPLYISLNKIGLSCHAYIYILYRFSVPFRSVICFLLFKPYYKKTLNALFLAFRVLN